MTITVASICYNNQGLSDMGVSAFRRAGRLLAAFVATLLLGAFVASAQTPPLAEVARKEEERRKTTKPPTKVLTNKDLPQVSSPPPAAQATPASDPPKAEAVEASKVDTKDKDQEDKPKGEEWWRGRITEAREQLHRDEVLLEALQSRVNALTTDFMGRDDPYQRTRIGEDRQKALAELERVRAEIVDLKKKMESIEEEARRASVPPGWLR
jgi:hypothetical protein